MLSFLTWHTVIQLLSLKFQTKQKAFVELQIFISGATFYWHSVVRASITAAKCVGGEFGTSFRV